MAAVKKFKLYIDCFHASGSLSHIKHSYGELTPKLLVSLFPTDTVGHLKKSNTLKFEANFF